MEVEIILRRGQLIYNTGQTLMVNLVPKKPDFFDQKYSQPALHVYPKYLLPRFMRL